MGPWKFRFDQQYYSTQNPENLSGFAGSAGLTATFSRSVSTVDPTGASVDAGSARFDRPTRVAPLLPDDEVFVLPQSRVLASGLDELGETPLTVLQNDYQIRLDVLKGPNNSVHSTSMVLTPLVVATVGNPEYPVHQTYAIKATASDEGPRIVPQSAVVAHGLIVVGGVYLERVGSDSNYTVKGFGFLISTNEGLTWTHLWNDAGQSDPDVNHWRGREWCLHVSFALNMVEHPDECWLAATDYRIQRNDDTPPPEGGRVTLIRFRRNYSLDQTWYPIWGAGETPFTYFIGAGSSLVATGCHLHSAHVAQYGETGLQMVVSIGDAQPHSRFVRFTIDDVTVSGHEADYANPANWNVDGGNASTPPDGYHGFRQTTTLGSRSQQPVGVAVGPRLSTYKPFSSANPAVRSTLIWGGDEQAEVLTRMVLPEPGDSPNQLWIEHLYGFNTGFGSNYEGDFTRLHGIVFALAQARPERADVDWAAPLVAVLSNADDTKSMTRVLYCPDPVQNPTLWMQLATRWGTSPGTAVVHGSKVYFVAYGDQTDVKGVRSIDVSGINANTATIFRPIIIAPGGKNLAVQSCYVKKGEQWTSNSTKPLLMLANPATPSLPPVGVDNIQGLGMRYLPPLPCVSARIFRVQTKRTVEGTIGNRFICRIHLSGAAADQWNQLVGGGWNSADAQVRRVRCWVLDGSWGVLTGANGQSHPNKTAQMSMRMIDGGTHNPDDFKGAPLLFSCSNRWCPLTIVGFRAIDQSGGANERGIGIELLCASDTGYDAFPPDDNYLYLAIDGAFDGNGSLPYPIALSPVAGPVSEGPDELLTIDASSTSVSLGFDQPWTIRLGGIVPSGTWDQYAQRTPVNDPGTDIRYWPLFTLWADDSNWIEFSANCVTRGFRVTVKANGSAQPYNFGDGDQLWLPESVLMAAISWDSASNPKKLYFGASLANGTMAKPTEFGFAVAWGSSVTRINEIRFRGAPGAGFSGFGEVSEFRWIGGQIEDAATTSEAGFKQLFQSIDFLKGP